MGWQDIHVSGVLLSHINLKFFIWLRGMSKLATIAKEMGKRSTKGLIAGFTGGNHV